MHAHAHAEGQDLQKVGSSSVQSLTAVPLTMATSACARHGQAHCHGRHTESSGWRPHARRFACTTSIPVRALKAGTEASPPPCEEQPSSCRLLALPCTVLQHVLSLCDARTLGALDGCASALHRPLPGAALSAVETAVRDAAAARYGPRRAVLLRVRVSSCMEIGADLEWLSCFPHEQEFVYPPITLLLPITGKQDEFVIGDSTVTVVDVEPKIA